MEIRKANSNDCKEIFEIINELEYHTLDYSAFKEVFNLLINSNALTMFVAQIDGKIVGNLNLRIEPQLHHAANVAEVVELAVDLNYRNQKIGSKLFIHAIEYAKNNGCVVINVSSNIKRKDAHRFYQHQGLEITHYTLTKKIG